MQLARPSKHYEKKETTHKQDTAASRGGTNVYTPVDRSVHVTNGYDATDPL